MSDSQPVETDQDRYLAAMHAIGAGVAIKMGMDPGETSPKSLRVGVNSAMVQNSALASLLISKGVFTEEEWLEAIADGAESEVRSYEKFLSETLGSNVTLK